MDKSEIEMFHLFYSIILQIAYDQKMQNDWNLIWPVHWSVGSLPLLSINLHQSFNWAVDIISSQNIQPAYLGFVVDELFPQMKDTFLYVIFFPDSSICSHKMTDGLDMYLMLQTNMISRRNKRGICNLEAQLVEVGDENHFFLHSEWRNIEHCLTFKPTSKVQK